MSHNQRSHDANGWDRRSRAPRTKYGRREPTPGDLGPNAYPARCRLCGAPIDPAAGYRCFVGGPLLWASICAACVVAGRVPELLHLLATEPGGETAR